jgi:hypothetical protein
MQEGGGNGGLIAAAYVQVQDSDAPAAVAPAGSAGGSGEASPVTFRRHNTVAGTSGDRPDLAKALRMHQAQSRILGGGVSVKPRAGPNELQRHMQQLRSKSVMQRAEPKESELQAALRRANQRQTILEDRARAEAGMSELERTFHHKFAPAQ